MIYTYWSARLEDTIRMADAAPNAQIKDIYLELAEHFRRMDIITVIHDKGFVQTNQTCATASSSAPQPLLDRGFQNRDQSKRSGEGTPSRAATPAAAPARLNSYGKTAAR